MNFYVGQKVSLLHGIGTGRVIQVLEEGLVEVDFGDDFPIELHEDELVAVDPAEEKFFRNAPAKGGAKAAEPELPLKLGANLREISLGVLHESGNRYQFVLINPERRDILYTLHLKVRHKYAGVSSGFLAAGRLEKLFILSEEEQRQLRTVVFQSLFYQPGGGPPEAPLHHELDWHPELLNNKPVFIEPLERQGWLFGLRVKEQPVDLSPLQKNEYVKVKQNPSPARITREVDLHIEKLVPNPGRMLPAVMLDFQIGHFEKSISDALLDNVERLIFIHGVGDGVLRSEIAKRLKKIPQVRDFYPADSLRYGNGATEVLLM